MPKVTEQIQRGWADRQAPSSPTATSTAPWSSHLRFLKVKRRAGAGVSRSNPAVLTGDQAELRNTLTPAGAGQHLLTPMRCVLLKQKDAVDSLISSFFN